MRLGSIDHKPLADWITSIPLEDWPQQNRIDDQIRPSMVTDTNWHGFGTRTDDLVRELCGRHFVGLIPYQRMLSVVMPGHSIAPHIDEQGKDWVCRVHVPLTSNDKSFFWVEDGAYRFPPGSAYRVDTTKRHAVTNDGDCPRIHLMFDIKC